MLVDQERFSKILHECDSNIHERNSIGTLSEKTTHLILKNYYEPDKEYQEVPVCSFVADICKENQIVEIQTSSFNLLRKKLEVFLKEFSVTVVYPVSQIKYLHWIQSDGTVTAPRRSNKKGAAYDILPQLVYILPYLWNPNLHFEIVLLETNEFRFQDGWGNEGKRGSHRFDSVPKGIVDIVSINNPKDLRKILPKSLNGSFSTADFKKATHFSSLRLSGALKVLKSSEIITLDHKEGKKYIYTFKESSL